MVATKTVKISNKKSKVLYTRNKSQGHWQLSWIHTRSQSLAA